MTNLDISTCYLGNVVPEKVLLGSDVIWPTIDYSQIPLTFEIISGGAIWWKRVGGSSTDARTIQYSKDDGQTWTSITSTTGDGVAIMVSAGDKVMVKGTNSTYFYSAASNRFGLNSTCKTKVYGNILSLIYGDNYVNETELPSGNTANKQDNFKRLFYECTGLTDVQNIVMPANTKQECYSEMFYGCTNITKTPVLPAPVVAAGAYYEMFMGCTNLNHIKCLATSLAASSSTANFLYAVSATGTFVKAANMNSWPSGEDGIPTGWTVVNA